VAHSHSRRLYVRLGELERRGREARLREYDRAIRSMSNEELNALVEAGDPATAARLRAASNAQLAALISEVNALYLSGASGAELDARAAEIMSEWREGGTGWRKS
jgi:hypothetical protein